jgi:CRISPR-associated protein Csm1
MELENSPLGGEPEQQDRTGEPAASESKPEVSAPGGPAGPEAQEATRAAEAGVEQAALPEIQHPSEPEASPAGHPQEPGAPEPGPAPAPAAAPPEIEPVPTPEPPTAPGQAEPRDWLAAWRGQEPAGQLPGLDQVCSGNLVVEGLFTGAEAHLLSVEHGSLAALFRLKARAFRTAALREIVARRVADRLGLAVVLDSGDRFLLAGPARADWEDALHSLQREFDIWLFQHWQPAGLLRCCLTGAICNGGTLPVDALAQQRQHHKLQPLEGALRVGLRWNGRAFVQPAGPQVSRCAGCGAVTAVHLLGDESLCEQCARDTELGERIARLSRAWLCPEQDAEVAGPGLGLRFSAPADGHVPELDLDAGCWPLIRFLPAHADRTLTLAEVAAKSPGARGLLGCLRIEVDGVHEAFASAEGDAGRTVALGRALEAFFGPRLRDELNGRFRWMVPVSLGAHGALLAGPWADTLDLALRLSRDFRRMANDALSLSGGFSLVLPSLGLGLGAAEASALVAAARNAGGNRIAALGRVLEWPRAAALVHQAKKVSAWVRQRTVNVALLERLARLGTAADNGAEPWRAELASVLSATRIRNAPVRAWMSQLVTAPREQSAWPWIDLLARYALLAAGRRQPAGEAEAPAAEEPEPPPGESLEQTRPAEEQSTQ